MKHCIRYNSSTIANVKKDIESFKNEFNDFKSDLNNEFYDYLIKSVKVNDDLVKINNDILITKNKYYINIKNKRPIINNDTLITKTNYIKLKSVVRENINSLKTLKIIFITLKKTILTFQLILKS